METAITPPAHVADTAPAESAQVDTSADAGVNYTAPDAESYADQLDAFMSEASAAHAADVLVVPDPAATVPLTELAAVPPAVETPPTPQSSELSQLIAQNQQLMQLLVAQNQPKADAAPAAPPVKQAHEITALEHATDASRRALPQGAKDSTVSEYTRLQSILIRLQPYENDEKYGATAAPQIAEARAELVRVSERAEYEAHVARLETRLNDLESAPQRVQRAKATEDRIRATSTHEKFASVGFGHLAAAIKSGSIDMDLVFNGIDFGAIDQSQPDSYGQLNERLVMLNQLAGNIKFGAQPAAPAPAPAVPGTKISVPPAGLAPSARSTGTAAPIKTMYMVNETEEYDAQVSAWMAAQP